MTRHALLIGINEYPHFEGRNLKGCVNDVAVWRNLLRGRFGFPADHLHELVNGEATQAAIQAALEDVVVIGYAGHGSRVKDPSRRDGWAESIVPFDSERIEVAADPELTVGEVVEELSLLLVLPGQGLLLFAEELEAISVLIDREPTRLLVLQQHALLLEPEVSGLALAQLVLLLFRPLPTRDLGPARRRRLEGRVSLECLPPQIVRLVAVTRLEGRLSAGVQLTGAPLGLGLVLGEENGPLYEPRSDGTHAPPHRPRRHPHLPIDVAVELVHRHQAVAVGIGRSLEPLHEMVGEQAVPDVGRLERDFVDAAGGDQETTFAPEILQELVAQGRSGLKLAVLKRAPSRPAAIAGIDEEQNLLGVLVPVEEVLNALHGDAARPQVRGVCIVRDEVLLHPVGGLGPGVDHRRTMAREEEEHRVALGHAFG